MASYFVVLHSTPEEAGDNRKKFVQELAKKLGRKEQDINILLTDLPAVVTASPTKDFAQSLCQLIDDLGGLAEMMAEVSGVHAAVSAAATTASGSERPAFKAAKPASSQSKSAQNNPTKAGAGPVKKDEKPGPPKMPPRLTPAKEPNLRFASGDHFRTIQKLSQEGSEEKPAAPKPAPKVALEYATVETPDTTASEPAQKTAAQRPVMELPELDDVEKLLDQALSAPVESAPQQSTPSEPERAAEADSAPPAEEPSPAEEPAQPKKLKSKNSLAVISAFGKKGEKSTKSSAKWPSLKAPPPKAKKSSAKNEVLSTPAAPSPVEEVVLEVLEDGGETPPPAKKTIPRNKKILFGVLGSVLVAYLVLMVDPELIVSKETGSKVTLANVNTLLKQQDQIFKEMKNKPGADRLKDTVAWKSDELSGEGSIRVNLTSTSGTFDSGSLELSTPQAAALTPEEFTKGLRPRAWIKDLVVDKLRKDMNSDQLSGKAKITLADERSLDKIVASTVVTLEKTDNPEVVTGTVEVFFPGVTEQRPKNNMVEKDPDGQSKIYQKMRFSARMVAPEEKAPPKKAAAGAKAKKGKPAQEMPII